ncbi:MAG: hypothetical protein ACYT04_43830 [Nostoc sp.]
MKLEQDMRSREFALLGRLANIVPMRQLQRGIVWLVCLRCVI